MQITYLYNAETQRRREFFF